jgi:hypothetical protein
VSLIPITELSDEDAAAIAGFEIVVENAQAGDGHMDYVHKVKFVPKIEALAQLAKRFGLDKPEPDDSGKDVPTFIFPPGTEISIR